MAKIPSPCIGVCKFKRAGHCIGCSMTKEQKSLFKSLKKQRHKKAFVNLLLKQQMIMGKYRGWQQAYMRKCAKKGVNSSFADPEKQS